MMMIAHISTIMVVSSCSRARGRGAPARGDPGARDGVGGKNATMIGGRGRGRGRMGMAVIRRRRGGHGGQHGRCPAG